jgi:predicted  nucleic acid-binding Zn-ribbon protein
MRELLELQSLDMKIERCRAQEREIPKQKGKFDLQKKRLDEELAACEQRTKNLQIEQRSCESEIQQKQEQMKKYDGQLGNVRKNEEYTALLHEIDILKKQIAVKEERIIGIMMELDEAKQKLEEDKKRIGAEVSRIQAECAKIDVELADAVKERQALEGRRKPLAERVDPGTVRKYERIRAAHSGGRAVVAMEGESCGGCHMTLRPQIVNEVLAGEKPHTCSQCGRMLFFPGNVGLADVLEGSDQDAVIS